MSDPVITSEEDFKRNDTLMDETELRIRKQSIDEKWSSDRTEKTLIDALLPYYKAKNEPASPAAAAWQKEYLKEQDGDAVLLDAAKYPQLTTIIAEQTRLMNAFHGTKYTPPPLIIVDGFSDAIHSPMQMDRDAILVDKDYFVAHANDPLLAGGIAHEMAHRYQRSDAMLRLEVKANVLEHDPSDQDKVFVRAQEAEADFIGRRVTSPKVMAAFMKDLYMEDAAAIGYYAKLHPEADVDSLVTDYVVLRKTERELWKASAAALPQAERDASFTIGIGIIDGTNHDEEHPKIRDRLRLQSALDKNDAVLSCKIVTLTENATILDATECGPKKVPLIVDGVPTGQKLRR